MSTFFTGFLLALGVLAAIASVMLVLWGALWFLILVFDIFRAAREHWRMIQARRTHRRAWKVQRPR